MVETGKLYGAVNLRCGHCAKEVKAEVKVFGHGYIAFCSECGRLLYNSKEPPKEMEKRE